MPNDLVRWNDLHTQFGDWFPVTTQRVVKEGYAFKIVYLGHTFEIRQRPGGKDFDVWGPAAIHAQAPA